jgi:hypothetical protein
VAAVLDPTGNRASRRSAYIALTPAPALKAAMPRLHVPRSAVLRPRSWPMPCHCACWGLALRGPSSTVVDRRPFEKGRTAVRRRAGASRAAVLYACPAYAPSSFISVRLCC